MAQDSWRLSSIVLALEPRVISDRITAVPTLGLSVDLNDRKGGRSLTPVTSGSVGSYSERRTIRYSYL